ncbi:MAG: CvpA family protein [Muribaculaceae bacterium]|nr:CvpA family protein [Muribaculaceae bacterium]
MSAADVTNIVLIIGAVGFGAWGIYRGLIRQIGWIAAFLCAFFAAKLFGPGLASAISIGLTLSYILLFIFTFIVITLVFRVLRFTAHLLLLGPIDRAAGMLAGLFKWVFFASLTLNLLHMCNPRWPIFGASLAAKAMRFAPWLFGQVTANL